MTLALAEVERSTNIVAENNVCCGGYMVVDNERESYNQLRQKSQYLKECL